jgi:carbon monoxide dehydrogenase subunit G
MQIRGRHDLPFPRALVWGALLDRAALEAAMPGCERLTETAPHRYEAAMNVGVAAITGHYAGSVAITDIEPQAGYRLEVEGGGRPGRMRGSGTLRLDAAQGGTAVHYEGQVDAFGPVAAVGQRLLGAAARLLIGQFFKGLERELARRSSVPAEGPRA